jgi:hypothetical protein
MVNQDAGSGADAPLTVPLRVSRHARVELTRAIETLGNLDWLGVRIAAPPNREEFRRISTVLLLPIQDGSATSPIGKTALIDIGQPIVLADELRVDVGWQSDSLAPLFPVFAGQLRISSTSLVLSGRYAPPFGRLGLLIDERILHFVARRTAQSFLDRLTAKIEE